MKKQGAVPSLDGARSAWESRWNGGERGSEEASVGGSTREECARLSAGEVAHEGEGV